MMLKEAGCGVEAQLAQLSTALKSKLIDAVQHLKISVPQYIGGLKLNQKFYSLRTPNMEPSAAFRFKSYFMW